MINITEVLRFFGLSTPPVSRPGEGTLYFDSSSHTWKVSSSGGNYFNLVTDEAGGTGGMTINSPVTGGTPGSVLFVNTGPVLAQDNAHLFWDNTNKSLGLGGQPVTQAGIIPTLWAQKDTASEAIFAFTNATNGGFSAITLGQAHDISDGNYLNILNFNSGFSTDGLFEAGTTAIGANSAQANSKLLLYHQTARPIVFATGGHAAGNARWQIDATGLAGLNGSQLSVGGGTLGGETARFKQISGGQYTIIVEPVNSTGVGALKLDNGTGNLIFELPGTSAGSVLFGQVGANSAIIFSTGTDRFMIGTLDNKDVLFGTNNIIREKIIGTGQHEYVVVTSTSALDFSANNYQTISLAADTTFTTSNRSAGRSISIKIVCDSTPRNLTFPAWIFLGSSAPTLIAANKTAILSLVCYGPNDTDVIAAYAVQP